MLRQDITLKRVPWCIRVYYAVDTYYADEIIDDLICLGCNGENLKRAKEHLWKGDLNTGLTYADVEHKDAVMVIGMTSSGEEFYNSLIHEQFHVLSYIAKTEGLDPFGEKIAYVAGELAQQMYSKARYLLCNCKRKKLYKQLW